MPAELVARGCGRKREERTVRSFYDLDMEDRIALTEGAIEKRATLMRRWETLHIERASGWDRRASIAAGMLTDCPSVADMGCGHMTLERYLSPGTRYLPVDVVRRDKRTIVVDFNRVPPPLLEAHTAVCLGLLEYLYDVEGFLDKLRAGYQILVVSYNPAYDHSLLKHRRAHAWVNDYAVGQIEALFDANGWEAAEALCLDGHQMLWKLTRVGGE
jgi:hypothetical protein